MALNNKVVGLIADQIREGVGLNEIAEDPEFQLSDTTLLFLQQYEELINNPERFAAWIEENSEKIPV